MARWGWRDGVGVAYLSNELHVFGGWNPTDFPGVESSKEHWKSTDGGANWTKLTDAPWVQRHSMVYGVNGGKIWLFGGDFLTGSYQKEVYTYDTVNGWVQVTSNWGATAGNRVLMAGCWHKNVFYIAGGQTDYTGGTMYTDIIKWNGSSFVAHGILPISNFSTGALVSDGQYLYMMGGAKYINASNPTNINSDVYRSADDGVNWTNVSTMPASITGKFYCNGTYYDSNIWFVSGVNSTQVNQQGIWRSPDRGVTWLHFSSTPPARHASGICTKDDNSGWFLAGGNFCNDVNLIT